MSEWIDVDLELPDDDTDVLVTDGTGYELASWTGREFISFGRCFSEVEPVNGVTHWTPLIRLPEEERRD